MPFLVFTSHSEHPYYTTSHHIATDFQNWGYRVDVLPDSPSATPSAASTPHPSSAPVHENRSLSSPSSRPSTSTTTPTFGLQPLRPSSPFDPTSSINAEYNESTSPAATGLDPALATTLAERRLATPLLMPQLQIPQRPANRSYARPDSAASRLGLQDIWLREYTVRMTPRTLEGVYAMLNGAGSSNTSLASSLRATTSALTLPLGTSSSHRGGGAPSTPRIVSQEHHAPLPPLAFPLPAIQEHPPNRGSSPSRSSTREVHTSCLRSLFCLPPIHSHSRSRKTRPNSRFSGRDLGLNGVRDDSSIDLPARPRSGVSVPRPEVARLGSRGRSVERERRIRIWRQLVEGEHVVSEQAAVEAPTPSERSTGSAVGHDDGGSRSDRGEEIETETRSEGEGEASSANGRMSEGRLQEIVRALGAMLARDIHTGHSSIGTERSARSGRAEGTRSGEEPREPEH